MATARSHLAAALVAAATSILMTWPLAAEAGHHVLRAIYFWDAYTNAMIMGSRVDALTGRAPLSLYDNYFFAPLPDSIVFNENLFGLSLLFAPLHLLSDNPLWAYNVTLLVSLALSVFFTYLLVLRLTGSAHAGIVTGVAFAFCPYVFFEIGRIQLVATQWLPACFFFLHRAVEGQRPRDVVSFWLSILLQVGTGLYYTMFLVPLLGVTAGALLVKHRPPRRFYVWFGSAGALAGALALAMVYPYFSARGAFDLERSLEFASSYDGKLGFFANVHETNRTLTALHHDSLRPGAPEEIAFPGFSVLALCLVALAVPLWERFRKDGGKRAALTLLSWSALCAVTAIVTLVERSMLAGALVFGGGAWLLARRKVPHPFRGTRGLYFAVLLVAIAMFLGLYPFEWNGAKVRGLYYYFHTYFPGYNGIRKVSRQAVTTTFALSVLGSFGAAWLFSKLRAGHPRLVATGLFLAALCFELRCFPHPLERVWAGDDVPAVLRFAATLPAEDFVASTPQNMGQARFRGDAGMALHNYLSLYHRHRFVNGQSTWQPAVTELARRALDRLPDDGARRALLATGARHVIVFGDDLKAERRNLSAELSRRPEQYRRLFQEGAHSVFTLLGAGDPTLELMEPPALPPKATLIPRNELRARASLDPARARLALDGNERTFWTSARYQEQGQSFDVELQSARSVTALEILAPGRVMDVPLSYRLSVAQNDEEYAVVAEQSVLRFYRAQIFSPRTFVFRIVLPEPVRADRVRISVEQPVPGHYFSIGELRLYAAD
jgi:hypothetical protein